MRALLFFKLLPWQIIFLVIVSASLLPVANIQAKSSAPLPIYLDSLWLEIESPKKSFANRLESWVIYTAETSVYANLYGHKAFQEKKALLAYFSTIVDKEDYYSQAILHYLQGEYYWKKGHTSTSLKFFQQTEQIVENKMEDYPHKKILYHYLGILYGEAGDPVTALYYAQKCLKACKEEADEKLEGLSYWNIGVLYGNLDRYKQEQAYLKKAAPIAEKLDYKYLKASVLSALCNNEHSPERVRHTDSLYQATISFCEKNNMTYEKYATLLNFGSFKMDVYPIEAAQKDFLECANYFESIKNDFWSSAVDAQLGNLYLRKKDFKKAFYHLQRANKTQEKLGLVKEESKTAYTIYEYYKISGNAPLALKYLEVAKTLNDSITKESNLLKIAQIEHEMEQKNQKNKHQEKVKRQQLIMIALSLGLLLLGISLLLAFKGYQNKQKANKKIQQQKIELEQLNISKDRIISVLAHDLRKPMLSFRGIGKKVKYLLDKQDYKRLITLGTALDKEVNDLNALLDNLLNWALLQKDSLYQQTEEVMVLPIVNQILHLFEKTASKKSIKLVHNIDPSHKVLADNNLLATIIRNLVDNALKFTETNGTVRISSEIVNKEMHISVQDSGIGIAPDKLNSIFLLQKKKSEKGTSGEQGSGLGLYLVKELTTLCKGQIKVSSQIGKGTSFFIHLPVCT